MKYTLALMVFGLVILTGCKPGGPTINTLNPDGTLNWIDLATAQEISNPEDKLFIVDMYTEWCAWCKRMDERTFSNPEVRAYLDEHFYVVKMDAETKDPLTFKGKTYEWQAGGRNGINTLALEMMNGRQSYPAMVYLDSDLQKVKYLPGYKRADQFMDELRTIVAENTD